MSDQGCYVGIKTCGCMVAAVVDEPGFESRTAESVAGFIRDGLKVEYVGVEVAREHLTECIHRQQRLGEGT